MTFRLLTCLALTTAGGTALAAAPVADSLSPGFSFAEYTGSAPVGIGQVDVDQTLFFIDEKSVGGVKSWLVFYDADRDFGFVEATLRFDRPILDVISTREGLDATTPLYGSDAVSYASVRLTGLERSDSLAWTFGGSTLDLRLITADPGDHIRVLTAVPEPATYALMLAGVGLFGWLRRHRR